MPGNPAQPECVINPSKRVHDNSKCVSIGAEVIIFLVMLARTASICGLLVTVLACFVILTFFCFQPTTAASKRPKKVKQECQIQQDKQGLYYVLCPDPTKKPGTKNKKKCNGCRGKRGPRGNRGKQGAIGRPGARGSRGAPGKPGKDGYDGLPGSPGITGSMGSKGRKGEIGVTGPMGQRGFTGQPGERGMPGIPGAPGFPGNCVRDNKLLQTTAPPVYCVRGPSGPMGLKGEQGLLGNAGPKGDKGSKGGTGRPGNRGRRGPQGPAGIIKFKCDSRYTKWVDVSKWNSNHPDVICDRKEFMQGFRMEKNLVRNLRRYKYICCTTKT